MSTTVTDMMRRSQQAHDRSLIRSRLPLLHTSRGPLTIAEAERFTCYGCVGVTEGCAFAWDDYNTQGDCLAIK